MKISLVVPVYNEIESLPAFYTAVRTFAYFDNHDVEIVFVNDGSSDGSEDLTEGLVSLDDRLVCVNFSRNFGKEAALFAGLETASGEIVIPMDVDLQDPLEVIPLMIEKAGEGFDVVLGRRVNRKSDSRAKRSFAALFYKMFNILADSPIPANVGDFRLMSRPVVDSVISLQERNLFMKGILTWVGFKTGIVDYSRPPRIAGVSSFSGWKLWNFAIEGVTSFSTVPLRIWTYIGSFVSMASIVYGIWMTLWTVAFGNPIAGYPSLIVAILFLGGIQLMGIGVLGEYIGRIYKESKGRPRYIIRDAQGFRLSQTPQI
jgi:glycosyltransferase involved in cell wall biosynthesis